MYTGGGNTLEVIKRDGSSTVLKGNEIFIDYGDFQNKTVGYLKADFLKIITQYFAEGYDRISITGMGYLSEFAKNISNDDFVIPIYSKHTLTVSNILTGNNDDLWARIEIDSYKNDKLIGAIQKGQFLNSFINIYDIPTIITKLSSLESRIQALENK